MFMADNQHTPGPDQVRDVIIIGAGPAGYTAAVYAARANLNPLLIAGNQMGGQIAITNEVENFPGSDTILGPELTEKMRVQAERFGTRLEVDGVLCVDLATGPPLYRQTHRPGGPRGGSGGWLAGQAGRPRVREPRTERRVVSFQILR
mgnify:CR=1 FL=1